VNSLIYGGLRFDKMNYQLTDYTNVESVNLNATEVKIISTLEKTASHWNKSVKIACVTKNDYIRNLFSVYSEELKETNWSCMVFDELDAARNWCGDS